MFRDTEMRECTREHCESDKFELSSKINRTLTANICNNCLSVYDTIKLCVMKKNIKKYIIVGVEEKYWKLTSTG